MALIFIIIFSFEYCFGILSYFVSSSCSFSEELGLGLLPVGLGGELNGGLDGELDGGLDGELDGELDGGLDGEFCLLSTASFARITVNRKTVTVKMALNVVTVSKKYK